MGEKLLVMTYVDDLLIVGEQHEQESFITKLSAHFPLKHRTKLDAKTPLTFLGKTLEHKASEHSINLHLPVILLHEAFQDVWHGECKDNKHNRRQAWSVR